ncbi:MAG: extensin family protein [Paracoccaceae bacterium]
MAFLWALSGSAVVAAPPMESPRPLPRVVTDTALAMTGSADAPALRPRPRPGSSAVEVIAATATIRHLRPHPRHGAAQRPAVIVQKAARTRVAALVASIRPPERPENLRRLSQAKAVAYRTQPVPEATTGRKGSVCGDPSIKGTTIPPIAAKLKGCGLSEGVTVTSVSGVALSTPATVDCTTASALKSWVESGVKPAVGKLGGGVSSLRVAASYSCRGRNNVKGAKVSEHGRGRAVDVSAIVLANGTAITVLKGWGSSAHGKKLKAMRKAACGTFNTVLGPGSDRYHSDHFHLDTARGRGAYCR